MDTQKSNASRGDNPFAGLNMSGIESGSHGNASGVGASYPDETFSPETSTPATRATRRSRNGEEGTEKITNRSRSVKRRGKDVSGGDGKKQRATEKEDASDPATSPSPGGTGTRRDAAADDPFDRIQKFMENQFRATNENITNMNGTLTKMNEKVGINARNLTRLKNTVTSNALDSDAEFKRLHQKINAQDQERIKSMGELWNEFEKLKELPDPRPGEVNAGGMGTSERDFWRARRSIRIWPVQPCDEEDLWRLAAKFVHENLAVTKGGLSSADIEDVKRVRERRRRDDQRVTGELVVTFKEKETRDWVMSHAPNLAPYVDQDMKPTAGIRLEIPAHLSAIFNDFLNYGRFLFTEHGKGLKRYVKFDEKELTLFMEVRLPGANEWLFVDRQMAAEHRRKKQHNNAAHSRAKLNKAGRQAPWHSRSGLGSGQSTTAGGSATGTEADKSMEIDELEVVEVLEKSASRGERNGGRHGVRAAEPGVATPTASAVPPVEPQMGKKTTTSEIRRPHVSKPEAARENVPLDKSKTLEKFGKKKTTREWEWE